MRIYVPSLSRAQNVRTMIGLAGDAELVWCVPEAQAAEYHDFGAVLTESGHPGQFQKMNEVLDRHGDEWVVFSDDDCLGIKLLTASGEIVPITIADAAAEMIRVATMRGDRYAALSMTNNTRYLSRTVTSWGQTANWLCAIAPHTPERFSPHHATAADIEFAAQIVDRYGRLTRPNYLMANYRAADRDSHWLAEHRLSSATKYEPIVRRYPHLFRGWKEGGGILYRRLPTRASS